MQDLRRNSIRCIAFDTVGTLLYADPPVARVYANMGRRFGSRKDEGEIAVAFKRCLEAAERSSRADGLQTDEAYERHWWRGIVAEVLDDVSDLEGCFEVLFEHFGRPESWRCYEDAAQSVRRLRDAGYRLVLTSNFDARLYGLQQGIEVLRGLSPVVLSTEVGYRKPHRAFFDAIVRATGLPRAGILHVGDSWLNDHQGAANAGLKSVWLCRGGSQNGEACVGDLRALTERLVGNRKTPTGG